MFNKICFKHLLLGLKSLLQRSCRLSTLWGLFGSLHILFRFANQRLAGKLEHRLSCGLGSRFGGSCRFGSRWFLHGRRLGRGFCHLRGGRRCGWFLLSLLFCFLLRRLTYKESDIKLDRIHMSRRRIKMSQICVTLKSTNRWNLPSPAGFIFIGYGTQMLHQTKTDAERVAWQVRLA